MTRLGRTGRLLITLAMTVAAIAVGMLLWRHHMVAPWTRDARISADVVAIAPDVSGLVSEVLVEDNQEVHSGQVLFRIDPTRFQLALRQAQSRLEAKQASYQQALDDYNRDRRLSERAITKQQLELAKTTMDAAKAALDEATADRDLAKLNLDRSSVQARVNGRIANMTLRPGDYVSTGKGVMALIDEDTLRLDAYFEETKLPNIHVGDRATIRLMGDDRLLTGHVQSIAGGIADRERSAASDFLPNVNPTFAWVRLAQRVPVRITLDSVPKGERLVVGRTATVTLSAPKTQQSAK